MTTTSSSEPTDLSSHFAFGKNWASYATLIGEHEIEEAERGLLKLMPAEDLQGRSFLDIGSGSGLHALAATRLGVRRVMAADIDPDSVSTAKALLEQHRAAVPWQVEQISVFDLDPAQFGVFDIVYSWGVLHHTGDMWRAIEKAASLAAPGGLFVFALYRSTTMDAFWKREKRWYAHASPISQAIARSIYLAMCRFACAARGIDYQHHIDHYRSSRGMDAYHDVHDWLGGYPYETTLAPEIERNLAALGFVPERVFAQPRTPGLLGSGCNEYVYRRRLPPAE